MFFRGDSTLLDERPGLRRYLRRAWLSWVYRHVDVALYAGTHNQAYFLAHGLRKEQLAWMPHAVDNDRFADAGGRYQIAAREWRDRLGIPACAPTVLFAGKLENKKAPDVLLDAFLSLNVEGHLLFVGSGPLEGSLRLKAGENRRVHFLGFQNQSCMPVVYRLGDVFVLPSRGPGETWALAVNEAMACGRAVVVSEQVGCAPDLVRENETGHIVPRDSVAALGTVLRRLMTEPARCALMGTKAAKWIDAWSILRQADCIEQVVVRSTTSSSPYPRAFIRHHERREVG
jgi:glycosyltransferase involved in cell wall biosynthesis